MPHKEQSPSPHAVAPAGPVRLHQQLQRAPRVRTPFFPAFFPATASLGLVCTPIAPCDLLACQRLRYLDLTDNDLTCETAERVKLTLSSGGCRWALGVFGCNYKSVTPAAAASPSSCFPTTKSGMKACRALWAQCAVELSPPVKICNILVAGAVRAAG